MGPERRSVIHHRTTRHEPCQPSIQGCYHGTRLQNPNLVPTQLTSLFDSSIPVIRLQCTGLIVKSIRLPMITWFSTQGALQLQTLWNASALLRTPPSKMLSTLPHPHLEKLKRLSEAIRSLFDANQGLFE